MRWNEKMDVKILSNNVPSGVGKEFRRLKKATFFQTGDFALIIKEYAFVNSKFSIVADYAFNDTEFSAIGDFIYAMQADDNEIYDDEINNIKDLIVEHY